MAQKKYYSKEYKLKSVELIKQKGGVKSAAMELGIREDMLRRWQREYMSSGSKAFSGSGHLLVSKTEEELELQKLRKELSDVKLERDIIKKAVGIFSKSDR
jgi:transposase